MAVFLGGVAATRTIFFDQNFMINDGRLYPMYSSDGQRSCSWDSGWAPLVSSIRYCPP